MAEQEESKVYIEDEEAEYEEYPGKTVTISFKIGEDSIEEEFPVEAIASKALSDELVTPRKIAYMISEKYKVPYSKVRPIVNAQLKQVEALREVLESIKAEKTEKKNRHCKKSSLQSNKTNRTAAEYKHIEVDNTPQAIKPIKRIIKLSQTTKSTTPRNIQFDRLYHKYFESLPSRKSKYEVIRKDQEERELFETKVRPTKSEYSTFLNFKLHYNLIPSDRKRVRKVSEAPESNLVESPSRPKQPGRSIGTLTERLYHEAIVLKQNKEKLQEEYYQQFSRPSIGLSKDPHSFYSRTLEWKQAKDDKLRAQSQDSGKYPFKPKISHYAESLRQEDGRIFNRLFEEDKLLKQKRAESEEKALSTIRHESSYRIRDPKSREITDENKSALFISLFNLLNPTEKPYITINLQHLNELGLDGKTLEQIFPVTSALISDRIAYTQSDFLKAVTKLYNEVLDYQQKRLLYDWFYGVKRRESPKKLRFEEQQRERSEKFTFVPFVSESSKRIAMHSSKTVGSFLERNMELLERKKSFISTKNLQKLNELMRSCSFKPRISAKLSNMSFRSMSSFDGASYFGGTAMKFRELDSVEEEK